MKNKIDSLIQLIEEHSDLVDFRSVETGVPDCWIAAADFYVFLEKYKKTCVS